MIADILLLGYALNMVIYFNMRQDLDNNRKSKFFRVLNHHGLDTYRFMNFYSSVMYRSGYFMMLIALIFIIRSFFT